MSQFSEDIHLQLKASFLLYFLSAYAFSRCSVDFVLFEEELVFVQEMWFFTQSQMQYLGLFVNQTLASSSLIKTLSRVHVSTLFIALLSFPTGWQCLSLTPDQACVTLRKRCIGGILYKRTVLSRS